MVGVVLFVCLVSGFGCFGVVFWLFWFFFLSRVDTVNDPLAYEEAKSTCLVNKSFIPIFQISKLKNKLMHKWV